MHYCYIIGFSGYLISFFNIWLFLRLVFGGYHSVNLYKIQYLWVFSSVGCIPNINMDQNTTHLNQNIEYLIKGWAFP